MILSDRVRANVRLLLEAKGMTYSDLGIHRQSVWNMLAGRRGFSCSRIDDFAAALKVDVSELTVVRSEFNEEARAK